MCKVVKFEVWRTEQFSIRDFSVVTPIPYVLCKNGVLSVCEICKMHFPSKNDNAIALSLTWEQDTLHHQQISELEIIAKLWSSPKKRKELDPITEGSRQLHNISNIFIYFGNFNNNHCSKPNSQQPKTDLAVDILAL